MNRFNKLILKHRFLVICIFTIITIILALFIPKVNINYDLSTYLPKDAQTKQALDVMQKEFGNMGTAEAMIKVSNINEALTIKQNIAKIKSIATAAFVDDFNILVDLGILKQEKIKNDFFKDGFAKFIIAFNENDYSLTTEKAIQELKEKYPNIILKGSAVNTSFTRAGSFEDIKYISYVALPLFIIILILMLDSYMESLLLLIAMFFALIINMGTNIVFDSISFYSLVCMIILQFAISMDYSIFLLHRFNDEKSKGLDKFHAMEIALKASLPTLLASCLTTVAGMLALVVMRYSIGFNLGIVLAKGILISLIACLIFLPALVLTFHKLVEKTHHKRLQLKLNKINKAIIKAKYIILPIFIIIIVLSFIYQRQNKFQYGSSALAASSGTKVYEDAQKLESVFGTNEPVALLVPSGNPEAESNLARSLKKIDGIKNIQSLYSYINPNMPTALIPQAYTKYFNSEKYSRIILYIDQDGESAEAFNIINDIKSTVSKYYKNYYILGDVIATMDIKDTVQSDYLYVNILSIISVFIIIALTLRSLKIPLLLILVIEGAIWINMAIPFLMKNNMIFLGYVIVSSLQLGATIDYAILFTKNYQEYKRTMDKTQALLATMNTSTQSIITSGGILASCGIAAGIISRISAISELAILVGRGALLSIATVLIVLPCALYIIDRK